MTSGPQPSLCASVSFSITTLQQLFFDVLAFQGDQGWEVPVCVPHTQHVVGIGLRRNWVGKKEQSSHALAVYVRIA